MSIALSRRSALRSLGALGAISAAVPLLPSLTRAQDAPKRFIVFWSPNGLFQPEFVPAGGFTLRKVLEPLAPYRSRMLVPHHVDWQSYFADPASPANDHPPPLSHCLCATDVVDYVAGRPGQGDAWGGGPSIDQFVADRIGTGAPYRSLVVSAENNPARGRLSYRKAREWVPPITDPRTVFDKFFSDLNNSTDSSADALRARRASVLDRISADLRALESRVSSEDRIKLQSHLEHVRSVEMRLQANSQSAGQCLPPDLSAQNSPENYIRTGRQHIDNMVMAMACDLTRVGLLEWDGARTRHSWLGHSEVHHTYAHYQAGLSDAENKNRLTQIARWYAEQFKYLLDKLDSVPEGGGTMLDHTIVLWTSEHRQNGGDHSRRDVPFVIAGAGDYFKMGQSVDCSGRAHNDLYVSVCQALGMSSVTSFGNPQVCKGEMPGLR